MTENKKIYYQNSQNGQVNDQQNYYGQGQRGGYNQYGNHNNHYNQNSGNNQRQQKNKNHQNHNQNQGHNQNKQNVHNQKQTQQQNQSNQTKRNSQNSSSFAEFGSWYEKPQTDSDKKEPENKNMEIHKKQNVPDPKSSQNTEAICVKPEKVEKKAEIQPAHDEHQNFESSTDYHHKRENSNGGGNKQNHNKTKGYNNNEIDYWGTYDTQKDYNIARQKNTQNYHSQGQNQNQQSKNQQYDQNNRGNNQNQKQYRDNRNYHSSKGYYYGEDDDNYDQNQEYDYGYENQHDDYKQGQQYYQKNSEIPKEKKQETPQSNNQKKQKKNQNGQMEQKTTPQAQKNQKKKKVVEEKKESLSPQKQDSQMSPDNSKYIAKPKALKFDKSENGEKSEPKSIEKSPEKHEKEKQLQILTIQEPTQNESLSPQVINRATKPESMAASKQSSGTGSGPSHNHNVRSRSQQQVKRNKKQESTSKLNVVQSNVPNPIESKDSLSQNVQSLNNQEPKTEHPIERKQHKLDPNKEEGQPILLVFTIETKNCTIEAFVRENTNLQFLNELISLLGDFKSCPKKFKEIFLNYLRNMKQQAMTQKKIQVIPTNQSQNTGLSTNEQPSSSNISDFQKNTQYDQNLNLAQMGLNNFNQPQYQFPAQNQFYNNQNQYHLTDIQQIENKNMNFMNQYQQFGIPNQNQYSSIPNMNMPNYGLDMNYGSRKESFDLYNDMGQNQQFASADPDRPNSSNPLVNNLEMGAKNLQQQHLNGTGSDQKERRDLQNDLINSMQGFNIENGPQQHGFNIQDLQSSFGKNNKYESQHYQGHGSLNTQSTNFVKQKRKQQ